MCNIFTSVASLMALFCSFSTLLYLDVQNNKPYCMYGINSELYKDNIILFGKEYFSLFIIIIIIIIFI